MAKPIRVTQSVNKVVPSHTASHKLDAHEFSADKTGGDKVQPRDYSNIHQGDSSHQEVSKNTSPASGTPKVVDIKSAATVLPAQPEKTNQSQSSDSEKKVVAQDLSDKTISHVEHVPAETHSIKESSTGSNVNVVTQHTVVPTVPGGGNQNQHASPTTSGITQVNVDTPTLIPTPAPAATISPEIIPVTLSLNDITAHEGTAVALNLNAALSDFVSGNLSSSIALSDIPESVTLSAGINQGNGTWSVPLTDLSGLTLTSTTDNNFSLTLSASATGVDGTPISLQGSIQVNVEPPIIISTPELISTPPDIVPVTLSLNDITAFEGTAVTLNLSTAFSDFISNGNLSSAITLSNIPESVTLSAGINQGNGTWSIPVSDLAGLTLTSTTDNDFSLTLSASATGADGTPIALQGSIQVNVEPPIIIPTPELITTPSEIIPVTLSLNDITAFEGTAVALNLSTAFSDFINSGNLSSIITVSNIPESVTLSAGINQGNGTWSIPVSDLAGLTLTSATDNDFSLTLSASATGVDGTPIALQGSIQINVEPPIIISTPEFISTPSDIVPLP